MFSALLTALINWLTSQLNARNPVMGKFAQNAALTAVAIVAALEDSSDPNHIKRQKAVDQVLKDMAEAGVGDGQKIDLPGDLERQLAGIAVDAAVAAMKKNDFFVNAGTWLNK